MLVVSTSEFSSELFGLVVPWGVDRSPKGPPSLTAEIGDRRFICRIGRKTSFTDSKRGSSIRLKGFGGGVFSYARDNQALKISAHALRGDEVLSLVPSAAEDEDHILLGALCARSDKEQILLPIEAEILFSAHSFEFGHSVSVFAARITSEDGMVVASSAKGLGSFVDSFSLEGHKVVARREIEDLIEC